MTGDGPQPRTCRAGDHLRLLQALSAELNRAMQAISSNNLPALEESISSQQDLSTQLSQQAKELSHSPSTQPPSAVDSIPQDLMVEIRAASAELERLNLRYSYLLQYSSRSVAMMASLFSSFKGQLKEVPGARSKMQTWSCRV